MGDPAMLETLAAIERTNTVDTLKGLLADTATETDLRPYSEMIGHQPHLAPLGNVRDALDRIGTDRATTEMYAVSVLAGVLARIVEAQHQEIGRLSKCVEELEKSRAKRPKK